jgi:homeobox protein cut-like
LLTNHSKSTNAAFLQVYSSLSEAPDPYPLLEASVDSLLLSEDTLPKVTAENEHLQKSVTKLTSQLEETESRLERERAAREAVEQNLEYKVKEVETSWGAVLEEKKDNWQAKEKALEDKVENQERLLKEIKATYEVSQRLGKNEEDGGSNGLVSSAELEIINSDLERTSLRLAEVEARNEQLRTELAQAATQRPNQQVLALEDEPAYLRLRAENSALLSKLDAARIEKEAKRREFSTKLRTLEREVAALREDEANMKQKLQKWSDYEDIKQELEVLKSIEFSTGDDDETVANSLSTPGEDGKGSKSESLEQMLLARNKKLTEELTILRVSHQDLQSRLQELQNELTKANQDLQTAQELNATLENDLATVQAESANAFPSGQSVAGTYKSHYPASIAPSAYQSRRQGRVSPTSSIISGLNPRESDGSGGGGILPMITAQRDRFKKLNTQLSQELSETHKAVTSLRAEIASLQKDNLNLYEKTRYINSYNRPGAGSSAIAEGTNASTVSFNSAPQLEQYRSTYESNVNPFAQFRGRESARAYKGMSLPERMVFSITRLVLATRTTRNLFAAYCVILHLLVFMSLYWAGMGGDHAISKVAVGGLKAASDAAQAKKDSLWDA